MPTVLFFQTDLKHVTYLKSFDTSNYFEIKWLLLRDRGDQPHLQDREVRRVDFIEHNFRAYILDGIQFSLTLEQARQQRAYDFLVLFDNQIVAGNFIIVKYDPSTGRDIDMDTDLVDFKCVTNNIRTLEKEEDFHFRFSNITKSRS